MSPAHPMATTKIIALALRRLRLGSGLFINIWNRMPHEFPIRRSPTLTWGEHFAGTLWSETGILCKFKLFKTRAQELPRLHYPCIEHQKGNQQRERSTPEPTLYRSDNT